MTCGNLCSCQFNWPIDTHGFKRDSISSEKAWLDFAVRFLSREAAGKANGQESVWNVESKPYWWNSEVKLPWKNPTSNPKDSKDILLKKYEALQKHLRVENAFPVDLEEEAKLWSEGKYKELFFLCSLTCLLKKVSGVHMAMVEAYSKADKMKAHITRPVLQNIQDCLNSTLKVTDKFKRIEDPLVRKELKRKMSQNEGKENSRLNQVKKIKQKTEIDRQLVPILPKPEQTTSTEVSSTQLASNVTVPPSSSEDILNFANRLIENRSQKKSTCCSNGPTNYSKNVLRKKLMKANKSTHSPESSFRTSNLTPDQGSSTNVKSLSLSSHSTLNNQQQSEQIANHDNSEVKLVSISDQHRKSIDLTLNPSLIEKHSETFSPNFSVTPSPCSTNSSSPLGHLVTDYAEFDFLLSPPANNSLTTDNFYFHADDIIPPPNLFECTQTQTQNGSVDLSNSIGQIPLPLENNFHNSNTNSYLDLPIINIDDISNSITSEIKEETGVTVHEENNRSPESTVSESKSYQHLSDGGYNSAEDLPCFDDLGTSEDPSWSLIRFLYTEKHQ